jgi:hypothetical protein
MTCCSGKQGLAPAGNITTFHFALKKLQSNHICLRALQREAIPAAPDTQLTIKGDLMKNITKSTIALGALAASLSASQANALVIDMPGAKWETKTICLQTEDKGDGSLTSSCDQSENNAANNRPLLANGCAAGQVALTETIDTNSGQTYQVNVDACFTQDDSGNGPVQL